MVRSRSFSIYLLKDGFDRSSALKDDNLLVGPVSADDIPAGAHLFVMDGTPRAPWWKPYFGVQQPLLQASKGALVFLTARERVFALAFGHVAHNLKDECFEHDFGLRVTLNCVDPRKLKNTDTLEPGSSRRRRTQLATETELTFFDFDYDSSVLKSITGKVKKEYEDLIKLATGSSNLRVNTGATAKELIELCEKFLDLYADDSYLASFPDIQKIAPVREPADIAILNRSLRDAVRARADSVSLAVPDLIDYNYDGSVFVAFTGAGSSELYPDVAIEHYLAYLDANGFDLAAVTVEQLKSQRMRMVDEFGDQRTSYQIYRSLVFDTTKPGDSAAYYLNEGTWYRVETDYVNGLQAALDGYFVPLDFLPDCTKATEGAYNIMAGDKPGFVCLDMKNVSPTRQTAIEPCDLYRVHKGRAVLIHVKISTSSSLLSHLFNQGANSLALLRGERQSVEKLVCLIKEKSRRGMDIAALTDPVREEKFEVVYAIITRKDPGEKALNLPLFSRISLARSVKTIHRIMGVPVSVGFIKDVTPKKPPKPRKAKSKVSKTSKT